MDISTWTQVSGPGRRDERRTIQPQVRIRLGLVGKAPSSTRWARPTCLPLVALGRLGVGPPHEAPPHDANSHHHRASPSDQHPVDQRHSKDTPLSVTCSTPVFCGTGSNPRCSCTRTPAQLRITCMICIDRTRQKSLTSSVKSAATPEARHAGSDDRGPLLTICRACARTFRRSATGHMSALLLTENGRPIVEEDDEPQQCTDGEP